MAAEINVSSIDRASTSETGFNFSASIRVNSTGRTLSDSGAYTVHYDVFVKYLFSFTQTFQPSGGGDPIITLVAEETPHEEFLSSFGGLGTYAPNTDFADHSAYHTVGLDMQTLFDATYPDTSDTAYSLTSVQYKLEADAQLDRNGAAVLTSAKLEETNYRTLPP